MAPKVDLTKYQHVFVQHLLTDGRGTDEIIARELRHLGYDAIAGPHQMMPENTEMVVIYDDQWNFDFTYYMMKLHLQVLTARTEKLVAESYVDHPSLVGNSPVDMVDTALKGLFKRKGPAIPDPAPAPGPESTSPMS